MLLFFSRQLLVLTFLNLLKDLIFMFVIDWKTYYWRLLVVSSLHPDLYCLCLYYLFILVFIFLFQMRWVNDEASTSFTFMSQMFIGIKCYLGGIFLLLPETTLPIGCWFKLIALRLISSIFLFLFLSLNTLQFIFVLSNCFAGIQIRIPIILDGVLSFNAKLIFGYL